MKNQIHINKINKNNTLKIKENSSDIFNNNYNQKKEISISIKYKNGLKETKDYNVKNYVLLIKMVMMQYLIAREITQ